jgi:hypothetical protein
MSALNGQLRSPPSPQAARVRENNVSLVGLLRHQTPARKSREGRLALQHPELLAFRIGRLLAHYGLRDLNDKVVAGPLTWAIQ